MGWFGHEDGSIEHFIPDVKKWSGVPPRHKLNRCPECGASQENKRVFLWYANGGWSVICADCHYHHQLAETEELAVKIWNTKQEDE